MEFHNIWCRDTAHASYKDKWSEDNPSYGQCLPTCLLLQDFYGGDIYATKVKKHSHFIIIINDKIYDPTKEQFGEGDIIYSVPLKKKNRNQLLQNNNVKYRYELLRKRYMEAM